MTIRKIIYLPDPRLRKVCEQVTDIDNAESQTLIDDMFETMYAADGVGLAANQIGICKQIAVIDVTSDKSQQICIINPEIVEEAQEKKMSEGCLSVPGFYEEVMRPTYVKVRALDRHGKLFEVEGRDLLAECLHHEVQHLNGKLFIDLLSALKRERIKQKLKKQLREQKR